MKELFLEKLPLSLAIITKNEEKNIERCLRSVPFAGDVVIVDSESTDRTLEIAQNLGARVFTEPWKGFGPQKRLAAQKCRYDWVLSLDADEALSENLAQEIQQRFVDLDPRKGYLLPRKSFHLGRWIGYGGWYPDYQLRLFHRQNAQWNLAPIHEKVEAQEKDYFKNEIRHWVFRDLAHQVETNNRYSTLQAQDLFQQGKKFSFFKLLTKPVSKFIETYFWKRGFLDGQAGLIISVSAAYSVFLKWSKLWELQKLKRSV